jgi:hypothetical protein
MKNLAYVLLSIVLTMVAWGSYGPMLNWGGAAMGQAHWLPFLFVGLAYFLIAVLATWGLLAWRGEPGSFTAGGVFWSFLAGVVTAVGALCVILALTNKGSPIYVMPLVFGGAPVVNTLLTMWMSKTHREAGPGFYAGLILVIIGAVFVLVFNPAGRAATEITFPELLKVLGFVALTALCWGSYGPLLHRGQMQMQGSRLRPYLCVGLAYFVIAVLVPLVLLATGVEHGQVTVPGVLWSLAGGVAGALGSLGVILAFTFGGKPIYVMPLVFGGAPVVNTFVSIATAANLPNMSPLKYAFFYAGLIVVIAGAVTVLLFAPRGQPHKPAEAAPAAPSPEPAKT